MRGFYSTRPLDGLRGIAALMVFVTHIGGAGYFKWIVGFGQLGVVLFFVLSGFLMGMLYAEHASDVRHWLRYAIRRVFRVYPMFAFVVLLSYVVYDPLGQDWGVPIDGATLFGELTLRRGVLHLWTIPVELKFYALFPLVAVGITRVSSPRLRTGLLAALLGVFLVVPNKTIPGVLHYVDVFLFGVLAAQLHSLALRPAVPERRVAWSGAVVLSFLALFLLIPSVSDALFGRTFHPFGDSWATATPCIVLILAAPRSGGWVRALLESRPARFLGMVSYSFYLIHVHVVRGIHFNLELPDPIKIALMLVATPALAWLCYRLIETPFRELGRKLARRLDPLPEP